MVGVRLSNNSISMLVYRQVQVALILCKMRNPDLSGNIKAQDKYFDDSDAGKIAESLLYVRDPESWNCNCLNLWLFFSYPFGSDSSITQLNLGDNKIGDLGGAQLFRALWDSSRPPGSVSLLATATFNRSLTNLFLYANQIGDGGATAIGQALGYECGLCLAILMFL